MSANSHLIEARQKGMRRPTWYALEGSESADFPKLLLFKSPVGSKRLMRFGEVVTVNPQVARNPCRNGKFLLRETSV